MKIFTCNWYQRWALIRSMMALDYKIVSRTGIRGGYRYVFIKNSN